MTWVWALVAALFGWSLVMAIQGGRAATAAFIEQMVMLAVACALGVGSRGLLGAPLGLVVLPPAIAAVWFGRTPLGLLNFLLLQWFGVRLEASIDTDLHIDLVAGDDVDVQFDIQFKQQMGRWWSRYAPRGGRVSWSLLRWVWPLTGWWSEYRWIAKREGVR